MAGRGRQCQFAAPLVVAGPCSVLTLQLPLGGGKPQPLQDLLEGTDPPKDAEAPPDPLTRRLRRDLTAIRGFTRARPTTQDLFQVAQLWLGARMVAASVAGAGRSAPRGGSPRDSDDGPCPPHAAPRPRGGPPPLPPGRPVHRPAP